jgi:hypothetical protein
VIKVKKNNIVKAVIVIGIIALVVVLAHLVGGNIAGMIKSHMGM